MRAVRFREVGVERERGGRGRQRARSRLLAADRPVLGQFAPRDGEPHVGEGERRIARHRPLEVLDRPRELLRGVPDEGMATSEVLLVGLHVVRGFAMQTLPLDG